MMIEEASTQDGRASEDETKVLKTSVPAGFREELHRRKALSDRTIKEMVQEALAEYLDLPPSGRRGAESELAGETAG